MEGFEPPTHWLQISSSGQLSYIGNLDTLSFLSMQLFSTTTKSFPLIFNEQYNIPPKKGLQMYETNIIEQMDGEKISNKKHWVFTDKLLPACRLN